MSQPANALVRLAARTLPAGPVQDRYRAEFLAELTGMSYGRQVRHALGVLAQSWSLRLAVTDPELTGWEGTHAMCRVRLHHEWRSHRTEDGGRYRRCRRCGKDDDAGIEPLVPPIAGP